MTVLARMTSVLSLALAAACSGESHHTVSPAAPAARDSGTDEAAAAAGDATAESGLDSGSAALVAARPYQMHVPAAYDATTPTPLVVMLHGYSASGPGEETYYFHLTQTSDAKGFLYAYPDGTMDTTGYRFWNATPACCNFYGSTVDDVAYLNAVLDDIASKYNVDRKRVFVGGHSNGGFMAHRFACESARRVAAIWSYAGAQTATPEQCQPAEPVSAVEMHGDSESGPYPILYDGGTNNGAPYPSAPATVDLWAKKDGCTGALTPMGAAFDLVSAIAGQETVVSAYTGCPAGIGAELWTVQGGNHMDTLSQPAFGDALWNFFSTHPKP